MLQKVTKRVFSPLIFQIVMLVVTAFMLIPFVHYAYGGYVKYILIFGLVVLAFWLIQNEPNIATDKASIVLLCFALSFLITVFLNGKLYFVSGIKQWLYMIV